MHSALATRALLRAVSWIAPRCSRHEWLRRWEAHLSGWQVLSDRGELTASDSAGILSFYRDGVREALVLRMRLEASQAFLYGPGVVLGAGAAVLILAAVFTHGFRGTRSWFDPVPVTDPAALVSIQYPGRPSDRAAALARLVPVWREKSAMARDVAGFRYAYNGSRAWVSWNFFSVAGTHPAAGRLFLPADRESVLLSYPAWRSLYGGKPGIIGATIRVDGQAYRVVGVLPELFWALSPAVDFWVPLTSETQPPNGLLSGAVARLRPGASPDQLGKELAAIAKAANASGPPRPVRILPFTNQLPGRSIYLYLIGTLFSIISGLVMIAREHRRPTGPSWGYWPFLALKTVLAIVIPLLIWTEVGAVLRTLQPALGASGFIARIVAALVFLVTCVRGLWWSFADQRRRCPVCLRRLTIPVTLGSPASVFDPALTELVCPNGHGTLALPEDETDRPDRWIALDSSWDELFKNKSA